MGKYDDTKTMEDAKKDFIGGTDSSGNLWGIDKLNAACIAYGKGKNATGARCIKVEDINRVTGYNPSSEKYKKGKSHEYGNKVTYYWDGKTEPYYEGTNEAKGNLGGITGVTHEGKFIYFNGTEFVESTLTDTNNAGASSTNKKEIVTIEGNYYTYYPRTFTDVADSETDESYPTKGIELSTKAYKMLFRNSDDTADVSYWLASPLTWTYEYLVGFGMRRVNKGNVVGQIFVASDYDFLGTTHGVRAVVKLNKDITLTGNSTDGWSY